MSTELGDQGEGFADFDIAEIQTTESIKGNSLLRRVASGVVDLFNRATDGLQTRVEESKHPRLSKALVGAAFVTAVFLAKDNYSV